MPTDTELIRWCAEKVMVWKQLSKDEVAQTFPCFYAKKEVWVQKGPSSKIQIFNPITNPADRDMVVERLMNLFPYMIRMDRYPREPREVLVSISGGGLWGLAQDISAGRALLLAAHEALSGEDGE